LGERLLCKQEVIGSNPFTSTTDEALASPADRRSGAAPRGTTARLPARGSEKFAIARSARERAGLFEG
jgi:hypothetical protein